MGIRSPTVDRFREFRAPVPGADARTGLRAERADLGVAHSGGHPDGVAAAKAARSEFERSRLASFLSATRSEDAIELATTLLQRRGNIAAVLASDATTLSTLIPHAPEAIRLIRSARKLMLASQMTELKEGPVFNSAELLLDYLRARLAHERREVLRVLYLDAKLALLTDEIAGIGSIRQAPAYPREIIRRALEVGAAAIIPVHNHPSGDPSPSQDDIDLTHRLAAITRQLDLEMPDHLIVTQSGWTSLRTLGLLEPS